MKKYINFLILTLLLAVTAEARVFNSTEEITITPAAGFDLVLDGDNVIIDGGKFVTSGSANASLPCPVLTQGERDAIGAPVSGDCVFNDTSDTLNIYDGSAWGAVGGGGLDKWTTGVAYVVDDIIWETGTEQIYRANTGHTASASFSTDIANWDKLSYPDGFTDTRISFSDGSGRLVDHSGLTYVSGSSTLTVGTLAADGINQIISGATNVDIAVSSSGTGAILLDDIAVKGNVVSADTTDGDVILQGNGNGEVVINDGAVFVSASAQTPDANDFVLFSKAGVPSTKDANGVERSLDAEKDRNVLTNASFEDSHAGAPALGWTSTNGVDSVIASPVINTEGKQALQAVMTAETFSRSQTFSCTNHPAVPVGFTVYVKTSQANVQVCGFDGTNDLNCVDVDSDDKYKQYLAENSGGGTCGIKIKSTSAITGTVQIDGAKFTDQPYRFVDVQNTTDWTDHGASTIRATTAAPTKGTVVVDKVFSRRVGDSLEVRYVFEQSSAGTAGAGEYIFEVPGGYTIDTTKIGQSSTSTDMRGDIVGVGKVGNSFTGGASTQEIVNVVVADSTGVSLFTETTGYNTLGYVGSGFFSFTNNPFHYSFTFTVPIEGWSATAKHVLTPLNSNLTDWVNDGASTITGTTTSPTKGTIVRDNVYYRRVGDSMEVRFEYEQSTAGTGGSGEYLLQIPAGLSIDTTKVHANTGGVKESIVGSGHASNTADGVNATSGHGLVKVYDTQNVAISIKQASTDTFVSWGTGYVSLANAAVIVTATFTVPIQGWEAEATIIGAFPFDRVQEKILSASVGSTGDIAGFQFDDLVVGDWYELSGSLYFDINANTFVIDIRSASAGGGDIYGTIAEATNATSYVSTQHVNIKFKATSSSMYANASVVTGGDLIGNSTKGRSFLQLTKLKTTTD